MERVRALSCLAVGAIALAMAAAAGAVAAPPRDLTAELAPVAARVPVSPGAGPVLDDEEHPDPTPAPSEEPGMDADPHGGMEDPAHEEDMASPEPMNMGGHTADPSPSAAPGHGHGAEPSPEPVASDAHGAMPGMDDEEMASHAPAGGGHDEVPAAGGHAEEGADGHGDAEPAGERPREAVLGGFFAINALVLAAAAVTRRRDRAKTAAKATTTPTTRKDASR